VAHNEPEHRKLAARIASHERWSRVEDRTAETAPARAGFLRRFETQVDPDGRLTLEERSRRAESAMKAHMARLALRSAKARQKGAA
jgi:hypothetical protein